MLRLSKRNLPKAVEDMLSFPDPSLLRASRIGRVMRRGAAIFKNSAGSAHTYELSDITTSINAFLSHNWTTSRWKKYMILALHFNCGTASLANGAVMIVLVILGCFDVLPSTVFQTTLYNRGLLSRVLSVPIFIIVLLFMRDVCPSRWSRTVFLDKTCIHQTDEVKKMQGIGKLGAYLMHSKTLVVCYNSLYLRKLWTVYEIASFLSTSPADSIKFIPTHIPMFFISTLLVAYVVDMVTLALQIAGSKVVIEMYAMGFFIAAAACMMRHASRDRLQIRRSLETFCVRDAMCYQENDRKVVNFNIAQMMRVCFGLPEDAPEREALDKFDQLVRTELPFVVEGCCGKLGLPYEYWVLLGYACLLPNVFDAVCGFYHGMPLRYFVVQFVLFYFFMTFVYGPLVVGMGVDWLCSAYVDLRGARQVLWMFFVCITACVSTIITSSVGTKIGDISMDNDTVLTLYVLGDVLLAAVTYCLSGRHQRCFSVEASPEDGNAEEPVFGSAVEPVDGSQLYHTHPTGLVQPEEDGPQPIEAPGSLPGFLGVLPTTNS